MDSALPFFSRNGIMNRRCYLLHSAAAALVFTAALFVMQDCLAVTLPTYLGPLFFFIALCILLVAATAGAFVVPVAALFFALYFNCFPEAELPKMSLGLGIPLALLFFALELACILRLTALAARRRRAMGKTLAPALLLPAPLYVGATLYATGQIDCGGGNVHFLAFLLPIGVQLWMLLRRA